MPYRKKQELLERSLKELDELIAKLRSKNKKVNKKK